MSVYYSKHTHKYIHFSTKLSTVFGVLFLVLFCFLVYIVTVLFFLLLSSFFLNNFINGPILNVSLLQYFLPWRSHVSGFYPHHVSRAKRIQVRITFERFYQVDYKGGMQFSAEDDLSFLYSLNGHKLVPFQVLF